MQHMHVGSHVDLTTLADAVSAKRAGSRVAWSVFSMGTLHPSDLSHITRLHCQSSIPRVVFTFSCPDDTLNCIYQHIHLFNSSSTFHTKWAHRDEQASPSAGLAKAGSRITDTTNERP